jgi:hypothetical protein
MLIVLLHPGADRARIIGLAVAERKQRIRKYLDASTAGDVDGDPVFASDTAGREDGELQRFAHQTCGWFP